MRNLTTYPSEGDFFIYLFIYMLEDHQTGSIVKTFVFQKEQTQQSTFVQRQIDLNSTLVDISSMLLVYCPPTEFKVSIYDPTVLKFVDLQKINTHQGLIPSHYLQPSIVMFKFKERDERIKDQNELSSSDQEDSNKQDIRSRQRTIRQVIALVKRWRQLIQNKHSSKFNKRLNFKEGSREIGISNKTLDGYYCQLRLAQLHNFNFTENIDQRIGKLRSFVKEHKGGETTRIRHHKQLKNLRVIEEFVFDKDMQEYIMLQKQLGDNQRLKEHSNSIERGLENPFLNEFSTHKIFQNLEDDYYKGFQFLLDQPTDPFLC